MKQRSVVIPPVVQEQIRSQLLFIAEGSIDNALAWESRLRAEINRLGEAGGHAIDDDASQRVGVTVRKVVFERTYIIHYVIREDAGRVELVNFRHGARLPRVGEP